MRERTKKKGRMRDENSLQFGEITKRAAFIINQLNLKAQQKKKKKSSKEKLSLRS